MTKKKSLIQQIGIPRLIIGIFLLMLFIAAPMAGVSLTDSVQNVLSRFGMFSVGIIA